MDSSDFKIKVTFFVSDNRLDVWIIWFVEGKCMCQSFSNVTVCLDTGRVLNSVCDCRCMSNMILLEYVT
jgi:hypothetical protein